MYNHINSGLDYTPIPKNVNVVIALVLGTAGGDMRHRDEGIRSQFRYFGEFVATKYACSSAAKGGVPADLVYVVKGLLVQ